MRPAELAGSAYRRCRQRGERGSYQHAGQQGRSLCHRHRRGTHDRAPHASDDQSGSCSTGVGIMKASGAASLQGKRGLVVGIANEASIAAGCARAFVAEGADLAATYLNDKARPHVSAVTDPLGCKLLLPCDVRVPGQLEAAFERIRTEWGQLDFLLHAIAFAPADDLHGRVVDCSAAGFAMAMDVSCHSFLSMARLAEPLMQAGGSLLTVTLYGSGRVGWPH